jgi:2-oxoglutarate dehydrogenase E1 component
VETTTAASGPQRPATGAKPVPKEQPPPAKPEVTEEPELMTLRGAAARTVTNMDASLTVPTATSVRSLPVKLLIDNRIVINSHLSRARGGKVSFTHLIGFALVRALRALPEMNVGFDVVDGKPTVVARRTSTSASRSTCPSPTAPASCWCRRSRPPRT